MKSITLKGNERESVGKSSTKALRNAGLVPCVIYGGEDPVHFSVSGKDLKPLVYTPDAHTVDIELSNGKKFRAAMQDLQFHPITDDLLHVDFVRLFDDKPVTIEVPVKFTGNSAGVRAGGVLAINLRKVMVKAFPANLPDYVVADISPLEIGGKLSAGSIPTDNYKILLPDTQVIAYVKTSRNAAKNAQEGGEAAK